MNAPNPFDPIERCGYDADAVERFPWPVVAGYHDVHRWMDAGQQVHAAWQLRDVWEAFVKFLASLAVADRLAGAAHDPSTGRLLGTLFAGPLSMGQWVTLMERALKDAPPGGLRLPRLKDLLFPSRGRPKLLPLLAGGDETRSFVAWRNRRFGHGVTGHGADALDTHAREATRWLGHLHDAFDLCRDLLGDLTLESDDPAGGPLTWGGASPLPSYHAHQPTPGAPTVRDVRVRLADGDVLDLGPLLSVQPCEVCGRWSAFFFDGFDRDKGRGWFLEFVDGHINKKPRQHDRLSAWAAAPRGEAAPGEQEKREPDPDRFRSFVGDFEPPTYLARRLAAFMAAGDRGIWLLTGSGGVGKSWVAWGIHSNGMLQEALGRALPRLFATVHGSKPPTVGEVLAGLRESARVEGWVVPVEVDAPTADARLCAWLTALMRQNPAAAELVVVLDGLDELPADSDVPSLLPPAAALPQKCWLVLTSRPERRAALEAGLSRARSAGPFAEAVVGPMDEDHREVLRRYAKKRLREPAWADALIDRASGSFLYVGHYCEALRYGVYDDVASLLPSPERFYPGFFAHLRRLVGDELFEGCHARTLAFIAAAGEPVGVRHLTEAGGLERLRLLSALEDLAPLLRTRREPGDEETLYALGHAAIEEFVRGDPQWRQRVGRENRRLAEETVRRFGDDWNAVDPFDAVESFLLFTLLDRVPATPEDDTEPWAKEMRERLYGDDGLAGACLEFGNSLKEMHRPNRSFEANTIAMTIWRDQVQREGLDDRKNDLAKALNNRGVALRSLHRPGEALEELGQAINIRRALVDSGKVQFANDLASALNNRGGALVELNRPAEALEDFGEAIGTYRTVVGSGETQIGNGCASALCNRGIAMMALGQPREAFSDLDLAVEIYRVLIGFGEAQFVIDLAKALESRGTALVKLTRSEEALEDFSEAIGTYRALIGGGEAQFASELASALNARGVALKVLRRSGEALEDFGLAIDGYRALVGSGKAQFATELAIALNMRGSALTGLDRLEEALADQDGAISIWRGLVASGKRQFAGDLANALFCRALLLVVSEEQPDAVAFYAEAINLYEECLRGGQEHLRVKAMRTVRCRLLTYSELAQWDDVASDALLFFHHSLPALVPGPPDDTIEKEAIAFVQSLHKIAPDDRDHLYAALGEHADFFRRLIEA